MRGVVTQVRVCAQVRVWPGEGGVVVQVRVCGGPGEVVWWPR